MEKCKKNSKTKKSQKEMQNKSSDSDLHANETHLWWSEEHRLKSSKKKMHNASTSEH